MARPSSGEETRELPADERLNAAIAEYLEAERSGTPPDGEEFLRRYPELRAELREFLADHQRMCATLVGAGAAAAETSDTQPRQFGDYELLDVIARGGMGIVYKARQRTLNRLVALKMILAGQFASADDVRRFHLEAEAAAHLDHPGIVPIHEVGQWAGQPFFSMGFIEGPSLADRLAAGPLEIAEAVDVARQVALAVAYAHAKGIVHRDLKPGNILLASPDSQAIREHAEPQSGRAADAVVAKITDFGLAKRLDSASDLTHTGQILGTPNYMPPEQALGQAGEVRETADIYAIGAILYTMLTGQPPFQAANPLDVLVQVIESEPVSPRVLRGRIPRELEWICLKCLDKRPSERYRSAADLADDLERFSKGDPLRASPEGLGARLQRWARREPALAAHLGASAAALTIVNGRFAIQPDIDILPYHLEVCELLFVWGGVSILCQQFLNRPRTMELGRYVWAALDVALLTILLEIIFPPRGPILVAYPLMIVASGLFFRVPLVLFTTGATMLAYPLLLLFVPDERPPVHYAILLELVLATIGLIVAFQVRRVQNLSRYYERRVA